MPAGDPGLEPVGPVFLADRLPPLHDELLSLLRDLREEDWRRSTSSSEWDVRDVVAHLLDGDVRKISVGRDGHHAPPPDEPLDTYDRLVDFLDAFNAEWVTAARRISPRLLIELLELVGPEMAARLAALDPFAPAPFAVAWAGDDTSPVWFDIGREYVERWHHQDQIRRAVGAPRLTEPRWLAPVIEISIRALPHAYRKTEAASGSTIVFAVEGEAGGSWSLVRGDGAWTLHAGAAPDPACRVRLGAAAAADVLLGELPGTERETAVEIEGREELAEPFFAARALMVPAPA